MPTVNMKSVTSRLKEFHRRRKIAAIDQYDRLVLALAAGESVADAQIDEALRAAEISPDVFDGDVSTAARRREAEEQYSHLQATQEALAKTEAETEAEESRHRKVMHEIMSRRRPLEADLKVAIRAGESLATSAPRVLKRGLSKISNAIHRQRLIIDQYLGLTYEERLLVRRVEHEDGRHSYTSFPGSNTHKAQLAVAAVLERERQLDEQKSAARDRVAELEKFRDQMRKLVYVALPSSDDINSILTAARLEVIAATTLVDDRLSIAEAGSPETTDDASNAE